MCENILSVIKNAEIPANIKEVYDFFSLFEYSDDDERLKQFEQIEKRFMMLRLKMLFNEFDNDTQKEAVKELTELYFEATKCIPENVKANWQHIKARAQVLKND